MGSKPRMEPVRDGPRSFFTHRIKQLFERSVMDVEQLETAEAQLNGFLDRQAAKVGEARAGQEHANRLEAEMRKAEERRTRQLHEENAVLWREHFIRMARNHHDLAAEYAAKADALKGDDAA